MATFAKIMKRLTTEPSYSFLDTELIEGLFESYDILYPNNYSKNTIGLEAFLLRKSVGEINFSEILDSILTNNHDIKAEHFIISLNVKRTEILKNKSLPIEKYFMLTRLIKFIQQDTTRFETNVKIIVNEMRTKMKHISIDSSVGNLAQTMNSIQNLSEHLNLQRHMHFEITDPTENFFYLQAKINQHLTDLLDKGMRNGFNTQLIQEFINIIKASFIIVDQPHYYVERKVREISLNPESNLYELIEPKNLTWKIYHFKIDINNLEQKLLCTKLESIKIKQKFQTKTIHFNDTLHHFRFLIHFNVKFHPNQSALSNKFPLCSLPFAIVSHTTQIASGLTKVLLHDIKQCSQPTQHIEENLKKSLIQFFIHRTGVKPKRDFENYLSEELKRARNRNPNRQTTEDDYAIFLVPLIHQIDFMSRHPIFAIFYEDGFFLGSCDKNLVKKNLKNLSDFNRIMIALRFNSINDPSKKPSVQTMKNPECSIRITLHDAGKYIDSTFGSNTLMIELAKFIKTVDGIIQKPIGILSTIADLSSRSPADLRDYFCDRLNEILKENEDYKNITSVFDHMKMPNGHTTPPSNDIQVSAYNLSFQSKQDLIRHVIEHEEFLKEFQRQIAQRDWIITKSSEQINFQLPSVQMNTTEDLLPERPVYNHVPNVDVFLYDNTGELSVQPDIRNTFSY